MISRAITNLKNTVELNTSGSIINYEYGFPYLEQYIKVRPNRNLIYAGEPKSGKTRKVMRMVFNLMYKYSNVICNLFSYEILDEDIVLWELCNLCGVSESVILQGRYNQALAKKLATTTTMLNRLNMNIFDKPMSLSDMETVMRSSAEAYKDLAVQCTERVLVDKIDSNGVKTKGYEKVMHSRYPLIINVIDHSRLVLRETNDEIANIQKLSRLMNTIRNDYNKNVFNIVISQYTRAVSSRDSKNDYEPRLSDLFGGSSVEQDANYVVGMANPFRNKVNEYYDFDISKLKQYFRAEHVMANRHGDSDVMVGLLCDFGKQRFYEIHSDDYNRRTFSMDKFNQFINTV